MTAVDSLPPLSRSAGDGRPAAPVRILHLGLGNFFRAHQAWYTEHAGDAEEWGIAAFTGRSAGLAEKLTAQQGLYTLLTRGPDGDRHEVVGALSAAHAGGDHEAWLRHWRDPALAVVTLTVTEAGWTRRPDGGLDTDRADVAADIAALRSGTGPVTTAAGRVLSGLAARLRAGGGLVAVVPCDNLPGNGEALAHVVAELASATGRPELAEAAGHACWVTTMVDRITPATEPADLDEVAEATGRADAAPVVTEPFTEWVLAGTFPAGRPRWEDAGAHFVPDVTPYEQRKLWLLNGAHSLLAYLGPLRGHATVAEAVADPGCRDPLLAWWREASARLTLPPSELAAYQERLLARFANPRLRHALAQIAADGSQKLPVRILPTLRAERAAGRLPTGATTVLAAWLLHLRGHGAPLRDPNVDPALASGPLPEAARAVLTFLAPELGTDAELASAVAELAASLVRSARWFGQEPNRRRTTSPAP
ncbi:mannitol dehydrogenase family protein [Streptacidiphilus jiangxiensis]|uniref:Fructuronate reductase n=1 Tax=Streptacidiphilus jiangxiensis TaxID=235985 RepID=A0A1H7QQQ6_STRJI|nr:mannitol dehydrogenase family protein [Streptacidiphilus jiangxiensis]SEL50330.1 fructuronate reductase [Streptacidiphilus jiangxiensis]